MTELEKKLGYRLKNHHLLDNALTHSSWANENKASRLRSNERLEFLGDSVLGMIVAEHLFRSFPDKPEGELTRMRAALVCESSLVEIARRLELGKCLKLGKGEESGGGRQRPSILADAFESVLAAVYLDGGFEQARKLVFRLLLDQRADSASEISDYKTALQELVQTRKDQALTYHLTGEDGPDHEKLFSVEVRLNGEVAGQGSGRSKKLAEQQAACAAYDKLK